MERSLGYTSPDWENKLPRLPSLGISESDAVRDFGVRREDLVDPWVETAKDAGMFVTMKAREGWTRVKDGVGWASDKMTPVFNGMKAGLDRVGDVAKGLMNPRWWAIGGAGAALWYVYGLFNWQRYGTIGPALQGMMDGLRGNM